MSTLSGGQQSRVSFALITVNKPHLILMDEVSNYLDHETCDALVVAIHNFPSGIVIVSHDQHLLKSCCTEFWSVAAHGVRVFETFEDARSFGYQSLNTRRS